MKKVLDQSPDVEGRRKSLVELCESLPGSEAERAGAQHLSFKVAKKIFAYYAYDHHGDGRIALLCKAPAGENSRLIEENSSRYFLPPYVGSRGWVGLRVDGPRINWTEIKNLLLASYVMTAPDKLRKQSGASQRGKSRRSAR